jgi:hypothetical protein
VFELEAPRAGHGENGRIARAQAIHRDGRVAGDRDRRGEDGDGDGQNESEREEQEMQARSGMLRQMRRRAKTNIERTSITRHSGLEKHKIPFVVGLKNAKPDFSGILVMIKQAGEPMQAESPDSPARKRISPTSRFHFTEYPQEAGHEQTGRDLKFFLDRQARIAKMLLPTSPTFDVGRSGLI